MLHVGHPFLLSPTGWPTALVSLDQTTSGRCQSSKCPSSSSMISPILLLLFHLHHHHHFRHHTSGARPCTLCHDHAVFMLIGYCGSKDLPCSDARARTCFANIDPHRPLRGGGFILKALTDNYCCQNRGLARHADSLLTMHVLMRQPCMTSDCSAQPPAMLLLQTW